ncbi:hypothetical protein SteCoe_8322 [Stentor coeruleus]|uniref:Uncharacterized protein n=1 Tax=Stentor coeruleus TaxID=5963 RepID=A0A1R2CKG9_9CILI|nr:hypothetical protein SteCoe_8322 [Stentor coeruleus]
MGQRWQCRRISPYDLMPDREMISCFSTKTDEKLNIHRSFKSQKAKSRKRIMYKNTPASQIKDCKVVKYHRPRFTKDLPDPVQLPILRKSTSPKPLRQSPNILTEEILENLIRKRKALILPSLNNLKTSKENIKESFLRSKSVASQDQVFKEKTLFQNVKQDIKNQSYDVESEMAYWQKQPIRKWYKRSNMIAMKKKSKIKIKQQVKQEIEKENNDVKKKKYNINGLLDMYKEEILGWGY